MVVTLLSKETDKLFHALADTTRRDIVWTVLVQEHSVSALARRYPMSVAAVQKHVAVLEDAGLVTKQRRGRESLVRGDIDRVRDALTSAAAKDRGLFRPEAVDRLLADPNGSLTPLGGNPLWQLALLEMWLQGRDL